MKDSDLLLTLVQEFEKTVPGVNLRYKDSSRFMAVVGFLIAPFNPRFGTHYITTLGKSVYFPSTNFVEKYPTSALAVLAHELVHIWDEHREGSVRYRLAYLFPQVLGLVTLPLYAVFFSAWPVLLALGAYLGCCVVVRKNKILAWLVLVAGCLVACSLPYYLSGMWGLVAFVLALLPFAPWPSHGRTRLELRGYAMSVAAHRWLLGENMTEAGLSNLQKHFTGPDYYFMSTDEGKVGASLRAALDRTVSGSICDDEPYAMIYDFLKKHGRLA